MIGERIKMSFCYDCGLPVNINSEDTLECKSYMCFECAFLRSGEKKIFEQDGNTYITAILEQEPANPRWNYPNERSHQNPKSYQDTIKDNIAKDIRDGLKGWISKPYDNEKLLFNIVPFMTKLNNDFGSRK
jgi:hypothetical protein